MSKEKISLGAVRNHFVSIRKDGVGKELDVDVKKYIDDSIGDFAKDMFLLRSGNKEDEKGNLVPAVDVPFHKAIEMHYGADIKSFLRAIGIYSSSDSLSGAARRLGANAFNKDGFEKLMMESVSFGANSTKDISTDFRFIIPELIAAAIRIGYDGASMNQNWIATTQTLTNSDRIKMPQILRGDGMPTKFNEGANMPVGSVEFGQKEVSVFKVGTGFVITDELIQRSSIDMMMIFMQNVGVDMSVGADTQAMSVLINGEQSDLSESAPSVGVNSTSEGFTFDDIKRITTRMKRLKHNPSRLITGENDGIDITSLSRFQGFDGVKTLATIQSIIGVPDTLINDVQITPDGKILFLDPQRAMAKLNYGTMKVERQRNPRNQTEELFISDWIGFAIIRRDARVLLDKNSTIGSSPFPAYMDIDARIAEAFNNY